MRIFFRRLLNLLPTGYWSGLGFGLVAFMLAALLLSVIYFTALPFVWAAIYGVAYVTPPGPYSPLSGEWLFVQAIWFISAIALGGTVSILSGSKTRWVLLTLALLWFVLTLAGAPNEGVEGWRMALHYLQVPLGVVFGILLRPSGQPKSTNS